MINYPHHPPYNIKGCVDWYEPQVDNISLPDNASYDDMVRHIEFCGRIAHQTTDKVKNLKGEEFVKRIIKMGHTSVLEHISLDIEITLCQHLTQEQKDVLYHELKQFSRKPTGRLNMIITRTSSSSSEHIYQESIHLMGNLRAIREFITYMANVETQLAVTVFAGLANARDKYPAFFWDMRDIGEPEMNREIPPWNVHYSTCCGQATFLVTTGRDVSHQLVRNRDLSFTQESQRMVKYRAVPIIDHFRYFRNSMSINGINILLRNAERAAQEYCDALDNGVKAEQARTILPNITKTQLVISGTRPQLVALFANRIGEHVYGPTDAIVREIKRQYENRN